MVSERRIAKIAIDLDVLHDLLEIPDDIYLHAIECDFSEAFVARQCRLVLEGPQLPVVPPEQLVPEIPACIKRDDEDGTIHYVWEFAQ